MSHTQEFIPIAEPDLGPNEEELLLKAYRSGFISSFGEYVTKFEENFAAYCKRKHAIAVSNGTAALHLALLSLNVGEGDEVIVPSLCFAAVAASVFYVGATPVLVDCVSPDTTMSIAAVREAITPRTKAVIAVHSYGNPVDMDPLLELAREHNFKVIEDAAEAHGGLYKGKIVGSLGDIAVFSFYGNKVITTGEGGIVLTDDPDIASKVKFYKNHGMAPTKRYWHPEVGYNYRMTNLQAAIGVAQLERIHEIIEKKDRVFTFYKSSASDLETKFPGLHINAQREDCVPGKWMVCLLLPENFTANMRDALCAKLQQKGIDTRPYFYPLHEMPPYAQLRTVNARGTSDLPVTRDLSARGLNLPSSTKVTEKQVERITKVLAKQIKKLALEEEGNESGA